MIEDSTTVLRSLCRLWGAGPVLGHDGISFIMQLRASRALNLCAEEVNMERWAGLGIEDQVINIARRYNIVAGGQTTI